MYKKSKSDMLKSKSFIMFKRKISKELKYASKKYPVVTIMGPRQSGKTTIVKNVFPKKPYVNLESLQMKELAESDPIAFLDKYPKGAILDEIQTVPKLLSEIQVRVDDSKLKGMFILTGSHQFKLHEAISQSLAGRTAILNLLPLSLEELKENKIKKNLDEILYKGFFPRIYNDKLNPTKAYSYYIQTYFEKDLRKILEIKNLRLFQKFLKLCAGRIGQIFNKENLANEVGVSAKTINNWISILEASHLIFLLPPYFENFNKRIIKSPKLYFTDVGLASFLLGIENISQIERDPLRGFLFENLIILELIKYRYNRGLDHNLYFYRDSQKNEIDVLFKKGHNLIPIEIKSAKTFNKSFLKNLLFFKKLTTTRCLKPSLIYSGKEEQMIEKVKLINFNNSSKAIE